MPNTFVLHKHSDGSYNYVLTMPNDDRWYVSYNPNPYMGNDAETALVLKKELTFNNKPVAHLNTFLILNGDYRAPYLACNTIEEALQVYIKAGNKVSEWSEMTVEEATELYNNLVAQKAKQGE